jgi:hypothetical protein
MSTEQARQDIGRRLAAVRASIRRAQLLRGGLLLATVALGGLLVIMAADHFLAPLPMAARWVLFGLWLAAVIAALWVGLRPLMRKIGLVQVARWIEGRHPEIEERMSTVLELSGGDAGASAGLMEELARAAGEDVGKVDPRAELKLVGAGRRWAKPAAVLAIMLAMLFVLWPKEAVRLVVRAMAPFSTLGNAAAVKFTVEPGDIEMLEGDALQIEVRYEGQAKNLELVMEMPDRSEIVQPMLPAGEGWNYRMDPVREGFRYHARAGRGESDSFTVTVWPSPMMLEPRVRLGFPEYSGLLLEEGSLGRGVEAVRGTMATLTGKLNTAVEEAWLEMDGKRALDGKVESEASGGRVSFAWQLEKEGGGEAVVWLRHRLGREVEALRFPVRVLEDQAPLVRWLSPMAKELRVRPDEVLGFRYEVTEDFGVASLQLETKTSGKEPVRSGQNLPEKVAGSVKPHRFRGEGEVAVGELLERWRGAKELRLRIRAVDGRPKDLDGPGVGHSEWLLLRIDQGAESLARQEMRAEHEGARETIEKAMQATREARERMDWHRGEMQNEELGKDAKKHFEEARDRLAKAKEDLEKLAERMQESVHANKADEVRKASEQVAAARQELESAPLQDGRQRREEKLDNAREEAEAAMKNLEEARNQMDRDRQKIEELARLQELAQQQRELARQAENQATATAENEPLAQDWQERQRQVEEQLRQQLREQPQARAEAMKDQAEEARKLAEEAKQLSDAQRALEEQAKQTPANAPMPEQAVQQLREALAKEQAKIAEETKQQVAEARQDLSETADVLPKAEAATREASEAMAKGEDQAAAEAAKEAVEALSESKAEAAEQAKDQGESDQGQPERGKPAASQAAEAERAAEIGELAERQEQVAEALQSLAEGKTAEALQDLQEMQADAAAEIAEAIAEVPEAEGSGHMNEARESARQGSEQAKSAAEKSSQGNPREAAGQHQQAANSLQRSAEALGRAAEDFERGVQQAQGQRPEQHRAAIPPKDLSQAFQSASRATGEQKQATQSAGEATQAAEALSRAAQSARQSMQGNSPGQPGMPGDPAGMPGEKSEEGERAPEADPGVPPELAKLGISAADWEKIQATLKSDVGGGATGVPEEYRGLVKKYFETMSDE